MSEYFISDEARVDMRKSLDKFSLEDSRGDVKGGQAVNPLSGKG